MSLSTPDYIEIQNVRASRNRAVSYKKSKFVDPKGKTDKPTITVEGNILLLAVN